MAILDRGRVVAEGTPAELTGAGAPRVRFRLDRVARPRPTPAALAAASARAPRLVADRARAAPYELAGLAAPPDPRLVAALAAWCAARGLLLTELRLGAASLEERYLELVGAARRRRRDRR